MSQENPNNTQTLGFRAAFISAPDPKNQNKYKIYPFFGGNGGTATVTISGLSADATKVSASNQTVYMASSAMGDAKLEGLELFDPFSEAIAAIEGLEYQDKVTIQKTNLNAPICSVILAANSIDMQSFVFYGLNKVQFSKHDVSLKTIESGKNPEVTMIKINGTAAVDDKLQGLITSHAPISIQDFSKFVFSHNEDWTSVDLPEDLIEWNQNASGIPSVSSPKSNGGD